MSGLVLLHPPRSAVWITPGGETLGPATYCTSVHSWLRERGGRITLTLSPFFSVTMTSESDGSFRMADCGAETCAVARAGTGAALRPAREKSHTTSAMKMRTPAAVATNSTGRFAIALPGSAAVGAGGGVGRGARVLGRGAGAAGCVAAGGTVGRLGDGS